MSELRSLKAKQFYNALLRLGYRKVSKHGGSHQKLVHPSYKPIIFAFHDKATIGPNLLRDILRDAGIDPDDIDL